MYCLPLVKSGSLVLVLLASFVTGAQSGALDQGAQLYADRCANCHGERGEKKALGRSRKLTDMTAAEIEETLQPYQLGLPAKNMKERMKSGLTDEQIEALAAYATQRKP